MYHGVTFNFGPAKVCSPDILRNFGLMTKIYGLLQLIIKRPLRDACLCMGDLQAPAASPAPHFVFLITL